MKKILFAIVGMIATHTIYAHPVAEPQFCPSVAAIKNVGVQFMINEALNGWTGYTESQHYDTELFWALRVYTNDAYTKNVANKADARKLADTIVSHLKLESGPDWNSNIGLWQCSYYAKKYRAYAYTDGY